MKSEVRPPYISRTISSRPSRPSAPRKNLPPASNQTRADRLALGVDDVALFAVDGDLFEGVGVVRPGFGDVLAPQRGGEDEDDDQDEEREERKRDAVPAQPPQARRQGLRPDDPAASAAGWSSAATSLLCSSPGRYLNWKLVRSCPKVGLKMILSRSISLETKVVSVRCP